MQYLDSYIVQYYVSAVNIMNNHEVLEFMPDYDFDNNLFGITITIKDPRFEPEVIAFVSALQLSKLMEVSYQKIYNGNLEITLT